MFSRVLVANRGEIAVRITRTCHDLGVQAVAVHSDPDRHARHVSLADQAVHLPGVTPAETYLDIEALIAAAHRTGAEAVHPGYGFLSERAGAARAFIDAGLVWVGPPPEALEATGDKVRARRLATSAGVSVVPGTVDPVRTAEEVHAFGDEHGYPIAIKATAGGGGKGFRVARQEGEAEDALEAAAREAGAYFGSAHVYLERYLDKPKHIEVQVLAPAPGQAMWLGGRDCSLQRRHQKLLEETPPPRFAEFVPAMGQAAVAVMNACGYVNAGTVEFLVDRNGGFFFLEVNARLQVEHTITEEVLGLDLVAAQLRIAAGDPLGFDPEDIAPRGHAIQCRINAEDPTRGFLPHPGRLAVYREPGGPGVRIDSGFSQGDAIPDAYDSLVAKAVAWAPTREEARRKMVRLLDEFEIEGVPTTIPAHRLLLEHPEFIDGSYSTATVEAGALDGLGPQAEPSTVAVEVPVLMVDGGPVRLWNPAIATSVSSAVGSATSDGTAAVVAPMHGTILQILVAEGDHVQAGDPIAILEAMKMETVLAATRQGLVKAVRAEQGTVVEAGEIVAVLE
jgi:acetyl-CoA/propionyl-CoA/long-chain acyl-CoA carboxylase, biotin carboxylase, biotin carboxyl carrier protein